MRKPRNEAHLGSQMFSSKKLGHNVTYEPIESTKT